EKLNERLSDKWGTMRGMEVIDVTFNTLKATEEDEARIKAFQDQAVYTNVNMAAARMTTATANAMEAAASNENAGSVMAFAGLNMAQNAAGGMNAANLFAMGQQQPQAAPTQQAAPILGWKCACGKDGNTGKFCAECGAKKPEAAGWTCSCGAVNQGKFCPSCGAKKPEGAPMYKCDKCGWEPEDPMNPPKFCPECGDIFDENDIK
ncbi:MAG: SPFH domain-containing protein, partial [Lachnospiraceae bacterium]|nr:SPFH domain-containing protein [Lachnospiraceae bacterium]